MKKMSDQNKKSKKVEAKAMTTEAKETKHIAMTCAAEGFTTRTRMEGRAKNWNKCWVCSKLYCKKNQKEYELCIEVCGEEDKEDSAVNIAAV